MRCKIHLLYTCKIINFSCKPSLAISADLLLFSTCNLVQLNNYNMVALFKAHSIAFSTAETDEHPGQFN